MIEIIIKYIQSHSTEMNYICIGLFILFLIKILIIDIIKEDKDNEDH